MNVKYSHKYPPGIILISDKLVRKSSRSYSEEYLFQVKGLVEYFINNPHELVVPVSNFQYKEIRNEYYQAYSSSIFESQINHYTYSYDMKRLCILSEDEKNIIERKLRPHKKFEPEQIKEIESKFVDYPELVIFCDKMKEWGVYEDYHAGNFLKDEQENYLTIDIEGFAPIECWNRKKKCLTT